MGIMHRNYDLENVARPEKMRLAIGGFYPSKEDRKFLQKLCIVINILITVTQFASAIIFLCFNKSEVTNFSEVLLYCMTELAYFCKLIQFVSSTKEVLELEDLWRCRLFTEVTPEEEAILESSKRNVRMICNIYKVLCVFAVFLYVLYPLVDGGRKVQKLPLPGWFPFDTYKYYYEIYIFEAVGIVLCAWFNSALDLMFIILMALGRAQFEVLQHRLRNIPTDVGEGEMAKGLRKCAKHYKSILRFVVLTENICSAGILAQILCSAGVICFTGFEMVVISFKSMQFAQRITYFNCMLCQIIVLCWYGQVLTDSSNKITEACYMADWINYNTSLRKSLFIIMERSKYPAKIKAGIFPANLETLTVILRSAYSYFALIYRIYTAKNEE